MLRQVRDQFFYRLQGYGNHFFHVLLMGVVTFRDCQCDVSSAIIHIGLVIDAGDLGDPGAGITQKQKHEKVTPPYAGDPGPRSLL